MGFGRAQAEEGEGAHGWGCPPPSVPIQSILYFCRNPNSLERQSFLFTSVCNGGIKRLEPDDSVFRKENELPSGSHAGVCADPRGEQEKQLGM